MRIDGAIYYDTQRDQPCCMDKEPYPLASNSGYREDIVYLGKNDMPRAEKEK